MADWRSSRWPSPSSRQASVSAGFSSVARRAASMPAALAARVQHLGQQRVRRRPARAAPAPRRGRPAGPRRSRPCPAPRAPRSSAGQPIAREAAGAQPGDVGVLGQQLAAPPRRPCSARRVRSATSARIASPRQNAPVEGDAVPSSSLARAAATWSSCRRASTRAIAAASSRASSSRAVSGSSPSASSSAACSISCSSRSMARSASAMTSAGPAGLELRSPSNSERSASSSFPARSYSSMRSTQCSARPGIARGQRAGPQDLVDVRRQRQIDHQRVQEAQQRACPPDRRCDRPARPPTTRHRGPGTPSPGRTAGRAARRSATAPSAREARRRIPPRRAAPPRTTGCARRAPACRRRSGRGTPPPRAGPCARRPRPAAGATAHRPRAATRRAPASWAASFSTASRSVETGSTIPSIYARRPQESTQGITGDSAANSGPEAPLQSAASGVEPGRATASPLVRRSRYRQVA